MINIPSAVKRGEEYCVIELDYNSHRHSNPGRNKARINFSACELYELRIRVAWVRVRLQNPDNVFGIVTLPKRKIGSSIFPESANFERHEIALKMSRFR